MLKVFTLTTFMVLLSATGIGQCRFLNENFNAAPVLSSTNTSNAWYPDRYAPAGFSNFLLGSNNVLKISIDGPGDGRLSRPSGFQTSFYNTQGRKFNQCMGCVTVLKGDLYIPADWATSHRRSDMWATAFNSSNGISAYPIIGFRNVDGNTPGIDCYNISTGAWIPSGVSLVYDSWYHLEFRLVGTNLEYLVNNVVVATLPSLGSAYFGDIILQAFNFNDPTISLPATPSTDSYDAYWDNLITTGTNGAAVTNINTGETFCSIQSAIDAQNTVNGHVLSVGAGTYNEVVTINKDLEIRGPNYGIDPNTGSRLAEATISDGQILVPGANTVILNGLRIYQTNGISDVTLLGGSATVSIENCIYDRQGAIAGQGVRAITISNGTGIKSIAHNKFTGDGSGGVFGGHKTWNSGIYVNGGVGNNISFNSNSFNILRTAFNLDDYNAGIGLVSNHFKNCGTYLSFGGTTPTNGSFTLGANEFESTVDGIINFSNVDPAFRLDITSSSYDGTLFSALTLAKKFEVESHMYHRSRNGRNGLVYFVANNQYVIAVNPSIQLAVDYANNGGTVNLNAISFNQRVVLTKSLSLKGVTEATTILDGSSLGTGSGIVLNNGVTNVSIESMTIQNFSGTGPNSNAGIYGIGGNNNLSVQHVTLKNNIGGCGFYANGPVDNVLLNDLDVSGHSNAFGAARGIVIWNGLKSNITVTNCDVYNNNCCGIELQDGTASGVLMQNNNVHDNGDNGLGLIGLQGPGENLVKGNTVANNGRFGIEIKNPNGSGNTSGAGRVVVEDNLVSRTGSPGAEVRDLGGIVAIRRGVLAGNVEIPQGVVIRNNTVSGFVQPSTSDGFGIVVEGLYHQVTGNTLTGNDVGIQQQAGHLPYPGDGDQSNLADQYFGRGNSPMTCSVNISGNTFSSNTTNSRFIGSMSGAGIVTNVNTSEVFCSIQAAINDPQTLAGHVIQVSAGTYNEDVTVDKQLRIIGAGIGLSTVSGPIGGAGSTFTVASPGIIIEGFTITRDGNNLTDWNNSGLNTAGVAVQGLANNAEVHHCEITGMRTAIDINNSNGNNIHHNNIHFNRTGLIFRNQTDNTTLINNLITDNWTVGVLFLDGSSPLGSNNPVQSALNSNFHDNKISGNWYGQVVDRQAGGSIPAPGTNLKNFTCNWYGTLTPVITTANSTEPGYAAQIPVAYGGSAVAPGGQPDLAGAASANIVYTPFLLSGTDTNGNPNDGFQPAAGCVAPCALVLTPSSTQATCPTLANGTASVSVAGGTGTYTYAWSSGQTTSTINNLVAGTYTATVTDVNGCSGSVVIVVSNDPSGPVHNVNTGLNYCTIQAAINAASTVNGHVVTVDPGTYNEQVLINKSLTLQGVGATQPIINFTGTVSGKSALMDVSVDAVTIDNFHFNVDMSKLRSAIIASGASIDAITVKNNLIDAYGSPAGSYGDRNAVSINYGGTTNYRVANAGVNSIIFQNNTVNGTAPTSFFRAGLAADEAGATITGNTLMTINHDVVVRFGSNGAVSLSNNNFNGGGVELAEFNAGGGPITVSNNQFNATVANVSAPGSAVLRIKNNVFNNSASVTGNIFINHEWAISLENYKNISVDNNEFTPKAGSTSYHHVTVNTKSIATNSSTIVQIMVAANITNNKFNGSGSAGGSAISFLNHDNDAASFGVFNVNLNSFDLSIAKAIEQDMQTGSSSGASFPGYTAQIGSGSGAITTMAPWTAAINGTCNWYGTTTSATILGKVGPNVSAVPWLTSGADTEPGTTGFQTTEVCTACALVLTPSSTQATCPTLANGTASVSVTGGTGTYVYAWSSGQTTSTINNLVAGTYTATVTDVNGCSASVAIVVSNDPSGPVHNINTGLNYCTIQSAINAVPTVNGNTITVDAGTYNESVNINKSITLRAPNYLVSPNGGVRGSEATITGGLDVDNSASKTIIIEGFRFEGVSSPMRYNGNAPSTIAAVLTFRKNLVVNNSGQLAVDLGNATNSAVVILDDNNFMNMSGNAVQLNGGTGTLNATVTNNSITGTVTAGINTNGISTSLFDGNTISNTGQQGIQVAGTASNVTISNNVITNANTSNVADRGGIRLRGGSLSGFVSITNNIISGSNNGIVLPAPDDITGKSINVNNNNLSGNTKSINHLGTGGLNATCNWYGSLSSSVVATKINGPVTYLSYLIDGTDAMPGTMGFQPVPGSCVGSNDLNITCPAPLTVKCSADVPVPDITLVSATGTCTGIQVSFVNDVISAQTCVNKYSITRTYQATDDCGNTVTCQQIITVNDDVVPVITRLGLATVQLCLNSSYTDAGATALDNCAGNITNQIVVGGDVVNTAVPGIYTITYNVMDPCGNMATQVTRTVVVNAKPLFGFSAKSTGDAIQSANNNSGISSLTVNFCSGENLILSNLTRSVAGIGFREKLWSSGNVTAAGNPVPADRPETDISPSSAAGFFSNTYPNYSVSSGASGTITQDYTPYLDINGNNRYDAGVDCLGDKITLNYNIYLRPNVSAANKAICSNTSTALTVSNPNAVPGAVFNWTANYGAVTGGSGSGSNVSFGANAINETLVNTTNAPINVVYTLTPVGPSPRNCSGTPVTVTVTVNPLPTCLITGGSSTICPSASVVYSAPAGMSTYSWSVTGDGTIDGSNTGETVTVIAGAVCNGSYTVHLLITDANGCISSCDKTVNVKDETPPSLTGTAYAGTTGTDACKSNAATAAPFSAANAIQGYTDLCGGTVTATLTNTEVTGTECSWTVTYTFSVSDGCGNTLTGQTYSNTGGDQTAPVLTGTLPSGGSNINACSAPAGPSEADIAALYTDACGGPITVVKTVATTPVIPCTWTITYHYTIRDQCGNYAAPVNITYSGRDETPPQLVGTIPSGSTGINACTAPAGPTVADIAALYSDACGGAITVVKTIGAETIGVCGWSVTYHYTIADRCGNFATPIDITYSGSDQTAPTGTAPAAITGINACKPTQTDANAAFDATLAASGYTDNCNGPVTAEFVSAVISPSSTNCSWTVTYNFKVKDGCNNYLNSQSYTRSGGDVTAPTGTAPNAVINVNACLPTQAEANADFDATYAASGYTDNCGGVVTATLTSAVVSGTKCAWTVTYTFSVKDECNNTLASQSYTRSGGDKTAPTGTAPAAITLINTCLPTQAEADADFNATYAASGYTDNCGGVVTATLTSAVVSGTKCAWTVTYTFSVKDECNNTLASQSYTRSGGDKTPPVLTGTLPSGGTGINACSAPAGPTEADIAALYTDGCGGAITVVKTIGSQTVGVCGWSVIYHYTIRDQCNNYATPVDITYIGSDQTPPSITCPTIPAGGFLKSTVSGTCVYGVIGTEFDPTFSDNCSSVTIRYTVTGATTINSTIGSMANAILNFGSNTITWTATDACGNSSTCSFVVNVNKVTTITTVTVTPGVQQYSDKVTFEAKVTNCALAGDIGGTVTFKVGNMVIGTASVINGVATLSDQPLVEDQLYRINPNDPLSPTNGPLKPAAGKIVTAIFSGTDPDYIVNNATTTLEVTCEDGDLQYNGLTYFTVNPNNLSGTVVLSNYVLDRADGARGDIRNATLTFWRDAIGTGTILSPTIPIGLINPGNYQEGIASTSFNATLTSSEASGGGRVYQVLSKLNNYYCGESDAYTPITLAMPGQDFVTGGGYINMTAASAGSYAGTAGKKMNFGLVMKWNSSGKNLQGQVNVIYRRVVNNQLRIYQIKSNAINTLVVENVDNAGNPATGTAITFRRATIATKANFADITDPLAPISLGGNLSLTVTAWESTTNNTGALDRISVQLIGAGSTGLLFSSNWSGGKTIFQTLDGGKIQARNPSTVPTTPPAATRVANELVDKKPVMVAEELSITAYPNPSVAEFTVRIVSNSNEKIQVRILDNTGRVRLTENNFSNGSTHKMGMNLAAGVYYLEAIQGSQRKIIKLVKTN